MSSSPRSRRRVLIGVAAVIALAICAFAVFLLTRETGDVSNPDVEFRPEPTQTPTADPRPEKADTFVWAHYGYSKDRRRHLPTSTTVRPPFRRIWARTGSILLEFPPVIGGRSLYTVKNNAAVYALSKKTGRVRWKKKMGHLAAASPAYAGDRIFVAILERTKRGKGLVAALSTRNGRVLWRRALPSRTESSPLVDGGTVYLGSENGSVYALRASDGAVRWRVKVDGAVKSGLALSNGKLYFGDYSGNLYALRAATGARVWKAGTQGARFGLGSGRFYATPAVAYGRVYVGNTDGRMYSFSSASGKLAWAKKTGGYVYSSPAVAQVPGGRPTVYFGSYDKRFYALDARTGRPRWTHRAPGRISGGPTVIGDVVYFSDLDRKATYGLGARTGRKLFEFGRGAYNPVVSDGRLIYLTGYSSLYALRPISVAARQERRAQARREARSRAASRRAARSRDRRLQRACLRDARDRHPRRAARLRSFRRCIARERRAATLRACRRSARAHDHPARRLRSFRRCAARNR